MQSTDLLGLETPEPEVAHEQARDDLLLLNEEAEFSEEESRRLAQQEAY